MVPYESLKEHMQRGNYNIISARDQFTVPLGMIVVRSFETGLLDRDEQRFKRQIPGLDREREYRSKPFSVNHLLEKTMVGEIESSYSRPRILDDSEAELISNMSVEEILSEEYGNI